MRCDATIASLPAQDLPGHLADGLLKSCHRQLWYDRSWFERPPFYCFGELPASSGASSAPQRINAEKAQFHGIRVGYAQALTLALLAVAIISIQVAPDAASHSHAPSFAPCHLHREVRRTRAHVHAHARVHAHAQVSLNLFGGERPVFWRESRHYSIAAYLIGKNLAFLPLTATYPFFFLTFFFQLVRPYAPFQAYYLILLLVQWAGEGVGERISIQTPMPDLASPPRHGSPLAWAVRAQVGQLISLQLNSSRQLAGGIAALICTVLTGSFPLLKDIGGFVSVLSYGSFCRWGMVALLSVECAPFRPPLSNLPWVLAMVHVLLP